MFVFIILFSACMVLILDTALAHGYQGKTKLQAFPSGTANSENFRIPALITLHNGILLAAADARWNHGADGCGLDTIVSYSNDNGNTWHYSFANYFNDSTDAKHLEATAFIDPALLQGSDGTIYLLVDLFPGGVAINTAPRKPHSATGYININGTSRLVLYSSQLGQTDTNYTHYVSDFENGFAAIYPKANNSKPTNYVDENYYLYDKNKQPMKCKQLGSENIINQNVFFTNAKLHVREATYLWLKKSTDNGLTWSAPTILNPMVSKGDKGFYGVAPGRGIETSTGRLIFPCYDWEPEYTSIIYSDDKGKTWQRSGNMINNSSEAAIVDTNNTLFLFTRHGGYYVSKNNGTTWSKRKEIGIPITTSCQFSAIKYSKTMDEKPAILLSAATGGARENGSIFVGLVQKDDSIVWQHNYPIGINGETFQYSCLTELKNGNIGLLHEYNGTSIRYLNINIEDICSNMISN